MFGVSVQFGASGIRLPRILLGIFDDGLKFVEHADSGLEADARTLGLL